MTEIKLTTNDLVSIQQAATMLGKPRVTIYRWVKNGKMSGVKFGGIIYIPTSEVERLINA